MNKYYLAIDIGASSGRHILGSLQDGKLVLEEIYRFKNGVEEKNGHLCWNYENLFAEIKNGLRKCAEIGKIPVTMGIDTWGVDFVLLDQADKILGDTIAYRDSRTDGIDEAVEAILSAGELYQKTGIQKQIFNTIYQLYAVKKEHPEYLEQAETFLMVPDYFHFLLTGKKMNEYTNASTTGMLHAKRKEWDAEIIEKLGFKKALFGTLYPPKTVVGTFADAIKEEVGFDCTVVLPATHDTGSAVLSVPMKGSDSIYISSGTWSLMGVEQTEPNCSEESRMQNITNEGGIDYRFRYLKNIMGLWIIQSIKKEYKDRYSFNDLEQAARECQDFASVVDVNDNCFLAPKSMIGAIQEYCREKGDPVPETVGEIMQCAYQSLANCYKEAAASIESMTGRTYDKIRIVGGGCQDDYLNLLTARTTGKTVCAGPVEATAIGNIMAQMLGDGAVASIDEARACVAESFAIKNIENK